MTHPNLEVIAKFFTACAAHDEAGLRQVVFEDVQWTFPGRNPLSGVKAGIAEVIAFFDAMGSIMGRSNVKAESLVMGTNEAYVVECQHIWTNRDEGPNLDHYWCVLWRFENGEITGGRYFAADQYAVDEFFTNFGSS
jgi:ketosteroid isomerase-like protein